MLCESIKKDCIVSNDTYDNVGTAKIKRKFTFNLCQWYQMQMKMYLLIIFSFENCKFSEKIYLIKSKIMSMQPRCFGTNIKLYWASSFFLFSVFGQYFRYMVWVGIWNLTNLISFVLHIKSQRTADNIFISVASNYIELIAAI